MTQPQGLMPTRKNLRLKGFDYATVGSYFITIVTQDRRRLFGEVSDGCVTLNEAGKLVERTWRDLRSRFAHIQLDAFVIMPNHLHAIVALEPDPDHARLNLSEIVSAFKSISAVEYIRAVKQGAVPRFDGGVWQRNYFERIIRDERELSLIREYIANNPAGWMEDEENV